MNFSVLRPICTWLRNEGFQLRGFALAIARKKDTRGIGAARGGREGSVGSPELQLKPKEERYGLTFRVLPLQSAPDRNPSKNPNPQGN